MQNCVGGSDANPSPASGRKAAAPPRPGHGGPALPSGSPHAPSSRLSSPALTPGARCTPLGAEALGGPGPGQTALPACVTCGLTGPEQVGGREVRPGQPRRGHHPPRIAGSPRGRRACPGARPLAGAPPRLPRSPGSGQASGARAAQAHSPALPGVPWSRLGAQHSGAGHTASPSFRAAVHSRSRRTRRPRAGLAQGPGGGGDEVDAGLPLGTLVSFGAAGGR